MGESFSVQMPESLSLSEEQNHSYPDLTHHDHPDSPHSLTIACSQLQEEAMLMLQVQEIDEMLVPQNIRSCLHQRSGTDSDIHKYQIVRYL